MDQATMSGRRTTQGRHPAVPTRSARNGTGPTRAPNYDALVVGRFLLFPPGTLPDSLRGRAVPLYAVDLAPSERPEMYGEQLAWPLDAGDMEILRMLACGFPTRRIAAETGVSMRTVQRQVARLRRRLRLRDSDDIRTYLSQRGFDLSQTRGNGG